MALIGIDVSKATLDVCWLRDPSSLKLKTRKLDNSRKGMGDLLRWLEKNTKEPLSSMQVMMEATGVYHEALAYRLYEAGAEVYVCNPQHAHEFRKSLGTRSKTDRRDSVMLARFLASRAHQRWEPEPENIRYLKAMLARLHALDQDILREHNRLEKAQVQSVSAEVERSIHSMIEALEAEKKRLEKDIDDHIDGDPQLKNDRELLQSIPGIGRVLSSELMAAINSRQFRSADQCSAFLGLVPIQRQSGTSLDGQARMSKTGSARLRGKLYMAAVVAAHHNPIIQRQYQRLLQRGKNRMSAIGAAMRKLVLIAYGVLKHQSSYDPQWAT